MDILIEMEYLSQKEKLLEKLRSKYDWVQKRSKQGAKDYFVNQWNEFFETINEFFNAEDAYHHELKKVALIKPRNSPSKTPTHSFNNQSGSLSYNPLNRKAKEAHRNDWNLKQQSKWMDLY